MDYAATTGLYTAYTTDGANWTVGPTINAQSGSILGVGWNSHVACPPTLAPSSADGSTPPYIAYTWNQSQIQLGINMPNHGNNGAQNINFIQAF
jgi:hypothetical protein